MKRREFHVLARDYLTVHGITKEQHDEWVAEHGKPYTDDWFEWLMQPKTIAKIKEGE